MREEILRRPLVHAPRARSTEGRTIYAIGDIQGRYDLLASLLEAIVADLVAQPQGSVPLLVFCGGHIDHGPDSAKVLAALVWLSRHAPADVRVLQGSHERALLGFIDRPDTLSTWLALGGEATLRAFDVDVPAAHDASPQVLADTRDALSDRLPASQLALLRSAPTQTACGDYAFAHSAYPSRQKVMVHGNGDGSASVQEARGRIGIDTAAYSTGVLTALRLENRSAEILQVGGGIGVTQAPAPPPPQLHEVVTMRDALARLRPEY